MAVRTIAAGGGNWNATGTWIEGIVPILGDNVFAVGSSGQLTINVASACTSIDFTNYTNTLTVNNTLSVASAITLVAAMTIAGTGTLSITGTATLTSNGKTWSGAMGSTGAFTLTLTDSWIIAGTLTLTSTGVGAIYNGNSLTIGGGITVYGNGNRSVSGTTTFILNGTGTITSGVNSLIVNNLTFNTTGTITISGIMYYRGGTLTYIAGTIVVIGSTLYLQTAGATLNTSGMTWNSVWFRNQTHTLTSDLNLSGLLTLGSSSSTVTINGSTINANGGILMGSDGTTAIVTGTTNIKVTGGTITGVSTVQLRLNLEIAGDVTISNTADFRYNTGTLTYTSGKVTTTGSTFVITLPTTLINMDKMTWNTVTVTAGVTLTMNKFFSGSPTKKTTIQSSVASTPYTTTFQDTFEKTAKFIKISDCSLSRRGQLLVTTTNSDKGGNTGVRYTNQSPNGIAKNTPSIVDTMTNPALGLVADPCFY